MIKYSTEVYYAYAQIGVVPGTTLEQIRTVLRDAVAYRFSTRERTESIRRLVEFFDARERFGAPEAPFSDIRKAWHSKAKELHPDQNKTDKVTDEQLKEINAAYEIVDRIHKEARDYFLRDEKIRRAIEGEARQAAAREALAAGRQTAAAEEALRRAREDDDEFFTAGQGRQYAAPPEGDFGDVSALKYMAASLPRYIRHARLYYLPRNAVIGSRLVQHKGSHSLVYDIIMLQERDFLRARLNLGIEGSGSPALEMSRMTPAYIPIDTRMVFVPESGAANPYQFAKNYFVEKFGLDVAATGTG